MNVPEHSVLLVEDHEGDALLVLEHLQASEQVVYHVEHVTQLSEGLAALLHSPAIDVVLLDLSLPDSQGLETLLAVQERSRGLPIVVLAGSGDDGIGRECVAAGAQDYLAKGEIKPNDLRRSIGYAISRVEEARRAEFRRALNGYRNMSSATQSTTITAALAGSGAVSVRRPDTFQQALDAYCTLLTPYLGGLAESPRPPREHMERIVTLVAETSGGPRDLLDLHVAALDHVVARTASPSSWSIVYETRLLALEMMGLLVDFYRVGHRRLHSKEPTT